MKRFLLGMFAALLSVSAMATTLSPVQLLNPVGSTAGQVIASTGASAAPAWSNIGFTSLPQVAANTVLGNGTASTAAVTTLAVPSCSASGNALKWTSASGFSCGTGNALTANPLSQFASTTSAQLLGVISDETGSGSAVFGTAPTINQPNIVGVTGATSAAAGSVGEYVTNTTLATSMTTGVNLNVTSVSLTAGDWDVSGAIQLHPAGTTTYSSVLATISTTSLTGGPFGSATALNYAAPAAAGLAIGTPVVRISVSTTTTVYLVTTSVFASGTMTIDGIIRARRVR